MQAQATDAHAGDQPGTPLTVKLVAGIFLLHGVRLFVVKATPAFREGDPSALSELVGAAMPVLIAVGLLYLQRWAWWLATIASTACWVIPAALLGAWNELDLGAEFGDPRAMVQLFTVLGLIAFVSFLLLMHPRTRQAFARTRPEEF